MEKRYFNIKKGGHDLIKKESPSPQSIIDWFLVTLKENNIMNITEMIAT